MLNWFLILAKNSLALWKRARGRGEMEDWIFIVYDAKIPS